MWNKLRARHYAIILLLAVVTLETSAIAIDRFLSKGDDTAFAIDGKFRNNSFLDRFQIAEANAAPVPPTLAATFDAARLSRLSVNKSDLMPTKDPAASRLNNFNNVSDVDDSINLNNGQNAAPVQVEENLGAVRNWLEYTVKKGDSLAQISSLFGVKRELLASANQIQMKDGKSLRAGRKLRVPLTTSRMIYVVKEGESLSKIACRFGITIQDLIVENNFKTYSLQQGQEIGIPLRKKASGMVMVKKEPAIDIASLKIVPDSAPTSTGRSELALIPGKNKLQIAACPQVPVSLKIVKVPAGAPTAAHAPADPATPAAPTAPAPSAVKPVAALAPATKSPVITAVKSAPAAAAAKPAGDDEIKIVIHTIKNGDNLAGLARQYKTSISQIVSNNNLANSSLKVGKQVKIPVSKRFYRVMQVSSRKTPVRTHFQVPVSGNITDSYGWRFHPVWRKRLFHAGIDICATRGTPVSSSLPGQVVYAGWRTGYGKLIIVRHANGLSTRYGHLSSFTVRRGQMVKAGQMIAKVGSTGVATGPHLHFEIRRNGKTLNPRAMLLAR